MNLGHGWKRYERRRKHGRPHKRGRNYHHLVPVSRNGSNDVSNLLLIDLERHTAWHTLFRNLDIWEVRDLICRMADMKSKQRAA